MEYHGVRGCGSYIAMGRESEKCLRARPIVFALQGLSIISILSSWNLVKGPRLALSVMASVL